MPKTQKPPAYRKHKQSGQAVVTLRGPGGQRRDVLLGTYNTKASRSEYARVLAEWEAAGRCIADTSSDITVRELCSQYLAFAKRHYKRPDGETTNELRDYVLSMRPLHHLYADSPARKFGPLALKAVREIMVRGYVHPNPKYGKQRDLARGVVNQRINRIRRLFRWAVEQELIPAEVSHGLDAVAGLQKGRSEARETEKVKPVPAAFVEDTIEHCQPIVADMVRLQWLTGSRPGEICVMRGCDIEMGGKVWFYRPEQHKTSYRDHARVITLGPKAQEIVRRHLKPDLQAYLFSPEDTREEQDRLRKENRKSPMTPSQRARQRVKKPKRKPGNRYDTCSYGKAIVRALAMANRARACKPCKLLPQEQRCEECRRNEIPAWHLHQLRHSRATEIRKEAGIDAARAILGHRSPQITETYAELDLGKASELMERIG